MHKRKFVLQQREWVRVLTMSEKTPRAEKELWLGGTPYRDLLGLKVAIGAAIVGFAAGGLPIVLSASPTGMVYLVTHWIFIISFLVMVVGAAWQLLVSSGIVKRSRGRFRR
jgi:hypothetical protein